MGTRDPVRVEDKDFHRLPQYFGLEGLDHLGIDIDQDPSAFARFLELRKSRYGRTRPLTGWTRVSSGRIRCPAR
jgi:hypothetical protein